MEITGSRIPSLGNMTSAPLSDHAITPALVRHILTAAVLRMKSPAKRPACVPVTAREGSKAAPARLRAKHVGKMKGVIAFAYTENVTPIFAEAVVLVRFWTPQIDMYQRLRRESALMYTYSVVYPAGHS